MEDPQEWSSRLREWVLLLPGFFVTWYQVVFAHRAFLQRLTADRKGTLETLQPLIFWCINAVAATVLCRPDGGECWQVVTAKVAAGSLLLWLLLIAICRAKKAVDQWAIAEVICYASSAYVPIALLTRLDAAGHTGMSVFEKWLSGTPLTPWWHILPWQFWIEAATLPLALAFWGVFLARGLKSALPRWKTIRPYAGRIVVAVLLVGLLNGAVIVVRAIVDEKRDVVAVASIIALDNAPTISNAAAYQDAERFFRRTAVADVTPPGHRYQAQQLATMAAVASDEVLAQVYTLGHPSGRSIAKELSRHRRDPEEFEAIVETAIANSVARRRANISPTSTSRTLAHDLKRLRSLRSRPGFALPQELRVMFFASASPVLELWPCDFSKYER
jgi:hypothetical protein